MKRSKRARKIKINLLERDEKRTKRVITTFLIFFAVFGGGMGYFYNSALIDFAEQQKMNSELKAIVEKDKEARDIFKSYQELQQELQEKKKIVEKIADIQVSYVDVLGEIEQAIPDGVIIKEIDIQTVTAALNGYAHDHSDVAKFLSGLRRSPVFNDILVVSSDLDESSDTIVFSIKVGWEAEQK